jgi:hypothetical protein
MGLSEAQLSKRYYCRDGWLTKVKTTIIEAQPACSNVVLLGHKYPSAKV